MLSQQSVKYKGDKAFHAALTQLGLSALITTYEFGHVISLNAAQNGQFKLHFAQVGKPMGLALGKTAVLALATEKNLDMYQVITSAKLGSAGSYDAIFAPERSWYTGRISAHDVAVGDDAVYLVNTAFSCLMEFSLKGGPPSVFWKPTFILKPSYGDHCHLNGLTLQDDKPAFVTMVAQTSAPGTWRQHKRDGGCIVDIRTNQIVVDGLSMPHSPRISGTNLYYLNSGVGSLCRRDLISGADTIVTADLPGFARGMAIVGKYAFIANSLARETKAFGEIEILSSGKPLRCGISIVDLTNGRQMGFFEFTAGVRELFEIRLIRGKNVRLAGPNMDLEGFGQTFIFGNKIFYVGTDRQT